VDKTRICEKARNLRKNKTKSTLIDLHMQEKKGSKIATLKVQSIPTTNRLASKSSFSSGRIIFGLINCRNQTHFMTTFAISMAVGFNVLRISKTFCMLSTRIKMKIYDPKSLKKRFEFDHSTLICTVQFFI
jgi:hypothetical protein